MTHFVLIVLVLSVPAVLAIFLAKRDGKSPFAWPRHNKEQIAENPNEFGDPFYVVEEPKVATQSGQPVEDLANETTFKSGERA